MAEKHEIVELRNTIRDRKGPAVSLAESSSVASCRKVVASVKALLFGSSKKGAVLAPKPSESRCVSSARIERMMQSRTEFAREVDFEIEASKDHWSELEPSQGNEESSSYADDERVVHLTNGEIVESLRRQFAQMNDFFRDSAGFVEVGEKIAEGAQAEIFRAKCTGFHTEYVLKVFKQGSLMKDLQKQWPLGMLNRCRQGTVESNSVYSCAIWNGTVVMNGRFAFMMDRCWGDLRKLMDKRMECNNNRCPPLNALELEKNMYFIAKGMQSLHKDNIIHRDLKASNVLIHFYFGPFQGYDCSQDILSTWYACVVADYECSVGVVGTGFWRAPEILQGVKDRNVTSDLFSTKSDVYSFAMTCYEMVSGQIPFEGLLMNNYDVVLRGDRPILPEGTNPWVKELLSRCWHHDPIERPDFVEIIKYIEHHRQGCFE